MVNNIWLTWKLVYMLRTYKTFTLTIRFSKYEFNNRLLDDVILLNVRSSVILWTFYKIKIWGFKLIIHFYFRYFLEDWVEVTLGITLSNVTPPNNLLLNSYLENFTAELHVLYVLNTHAKFRANKILFSIQCNNSCFMYNFKYKNL